MQQQRMADLKKTLQREFKVQALPNDDHPPLPPAGGAPLSKSSSTPQGLNMLPDNYVHKKPNFTNSSGMATNHMQRQVDMILHNGGAGTGAGANGDRGQTRGNNHGAHTMEYNRDINFEYLRHVVLKFMLSRETEVSSWLVWTFSRFAKL